MGSTYIFFIFFIEFYKKVTLVDDRYVAIVFILRSLRNIPDIQTLHNNICAI